MKFWERVYMRDVVAVVILIMAFVAYCFGINSWLQGIIALVVGYYFSKRVYEERNLNNADKNN